MRNTIVFIGIIGFIICLLLMYATDLGERGLRKYDADFKLLDMRFHYTTADVSEAFEKLGEGGRKAYQNYWILDFVFIVCFLIVMLTITDKIAVSGWAIYILIALAIARAGFDIVENSLFLYLSKIYPAHNDSLATICSWTTTCKFISLYVWILGVVVMSLFPIIRRNFIQ